VADGIYTGEGNKNLDFLGKAIVVRSENGPEVTVIDCTWRGRGFVFHQGEGLDSRIEGFTITNGHVLYEGGGGIRCQGASPTIANCHIINNSASCSDRGGGVYCFASTPVITGCIIAGNDVYIEVDFSTSYGGGLSCTGGIIRDCIIYHNSAWSIGHWGGGVGGGIDCDSMSIINCTIHGNTADNGDGIYCSSKAHIMNCIIWQDRITGNPVVLYTNIQGGYPGEGNIDIDPLFRDPENGDYHLMATYCGDPYDSPCIDAGDPAILDEVLDCWHGLGTSRSDMGAYGGKNSGWPTAVEEEEDGNASVPMDFVLFQNYPNPFNSETRLQFHLAKPGQVKINIFNLLGQELQNLLEGHQEVGEQSVLWDASDFPSGIYFARLETKSFSKTIKMVLLR
jgi:hypothetical protein